MTNTEFEALKDGVFEAIEDKGLKPFELGKDLATIPFKVKVRYMLTYEHCKGLSGKEHQLGRRIGQHFCGQIKRDGVGLETLRATGLLISPEPGGYLVELEMASV